MNKIIFTVAMVGIALVQIRLVAIGLVSGYLDFYLISPIAIFICIYLLSKFYNNVTRAVLSFLIIILALNTMSILNMANEDSSALSLVISVLLVLLLNLALPLKAIRG